MSQEKVFQVGGVDLHVDNRSITGDGGPSVRVYGDVDGEAVQLLRFDCFRKDPHYHYDPSGRNDQHHLDQGNCPRFNWLDDGTTRKQPRRDDPHG